MGYCCVANCKNTNKNSLCVFYIFPTALWKLDQKLKWIAAVGLNRKNDDGSPWKPKPHATICSAHFVGGKKSDLQGSPSYVPTIFPTNEPLVLPRHNHLIKRTTTKAADTTATEVSDTSTNKIMEEAPSLVHQGSQDSTVTFNVYVDSENNVKVEHSNELEEIKLKQELNKECDLDDIEENKENQATPMDFTTSCYDLEDNVKAEHSSELEKIVIKQEPIKDCDLNNKKNQATPMATRTFVKPDKETSQVFVNKNEMGDDFDTFARNMAQQLRALPMDVALETQEMMWAILFKQRLKVNNVEDLFNKKNS